MTAWNQLSAINCESLEEYNAKLWDALLPVSSFKVVPLAEQIEKYCCGLPKGIKKYCTKTSVMNMAQLMENAEVADDLIQGKPDEDGFKTRRKEPQGKQFSAKGNVTSRLTVPPFKKKPFAGRQRQGFKRHFTGKTIEERKALRDARKCYICEEGHFANECPQRNSQNKDDKSDRKGKKPKPSAGLVPDLVGDKQNVDATELCRAWGKVRDQEVLVFFDPGARANFISPELASKLGIHVEEMGMIGEAGLACPGHSEAVTPILGKLRLHIQNYVDAEEFHIMPLQDCHVLLGIPWCYRLHAVVDTFHKKITLVHRGKTHVLDVKLKGESVPVVSAFAISSVIKNHLSAYLVFAKEVHEVESNLSKLDKDRAAFLNGFNDCFSDSLPDELPPERLEDHRIDVVPGSSPPNRPPYRVGASQQKEIMSQAAVKIGKEEGIQGYWKGNLPQVIRVIPYSAVQLLSYELYKKLFKGDKELSVAGRLGAGACAGMTSTLVTYPLDVLRLRLAVDPACKSMIQVATTMLREEGLSSFYRGLGPSLLGIAPYIALNFCAFDLIKKSLPEEMRKTPAASFLTAFLSASLATITCYPLDTVRRQLQMKGTPYVSVLDAIPGIVATDGVLGLYRGFVPNALKNLPNSSIRLTTFDAAKNLISTSQQEFQRLLNIRRGISSTAVDLPTPNGS
ncbi:hypothetical protein L7F22_056273 [Adiantum nelumboides]|nr:hypothetical protein [Adiantum nelumboides]